MREPDGEIAVGLFSLDTQRRAKGALLAFLDRFSLLPPS